MNDQLSFEGADELGQVWRDGLKPDPLLTVSEWADQHRYLSPRASAEPGRYRTDRTPYMRAIMDAMSPSHPARRVVFMKAAQVGATEAGNNWIGYVFHHGAGPCAAVRRAGRTGIERSPTALLAPVMISSPAGNSLDNTVLPASRERAGFTRCRRTGLSAISGSIRCRENRLASSTVGCTESIGPGA